ncbi:MAG: STM4014 family protein [Nostoc sp. DedVER02]|uniref:STM4014 family protein n=1 Tax=unclassified Nostoc TaxID=2593658 RepID=UPI002AD4FB61|nr:MULTISPECIES: STM4014 family protein [unclassified Nostoc]MDZ7984474.1 STM4014 family protein [Nostoc sp. DedVER02]MDZ8115579.1 STM4014 family protein [Nostoc sp. DedVER01b]
MKNFNFILIANPENRRVSFFQEAIAHFNLPPATVVDYADLIAGKQTLEQFNTPNTIIRFDSPEKNFDVDKAIIAEGSREIFSTSSHQHISAEAATKLEFDKGLILYPRQWYLGWRYLLQKWETQLTPLLTNGEFMNHPLDIAVMFDKPACHERFSRHNIPIPRSLGKIYNYDHLREQMQMQGIERVFVKLSHGSAASGVVAYRANSRFESAITTVERVRENGQTLLYNSRKIRHYTHREEIADIINILTAEGVQVEEWLPKAHLQECGFDVRVVVINGEAQHIVVRLGKSPMTNLHLGNERGNTEEFLAKVGVGNWEIMKRTCEQAAGLFPNSLYCGVDLLILPDWKTHAILEINAFGDLLPGILWNGMDTYMSEVKAILE